MYQKNRVRQVKHGEYNRIKANKSDDKLKTWRTLIEF